MPSTWAFAESWNNAIDGLIRENQHDVPDESGKPPLWFAANYGYSECVRKLCEAGVDIDRQDRLGQTALFQASAAGNVEVVEILLSHGADPNIWSENGLSPIYQAIMNRHKGVVELLLSRNPMIPSTVLSSIWRAAAQLMVDLLSKHGITPKR